MSNPPCRQKTQPSAADVFIMYFEALRAFLLLYADGSRTVIYMDTYFHIFSSNILP